MDRKWIQIDSKEIKIAMWQEIIHYVKCSKPGSFLNVRIVVDFLGIRQKLCNRGWKQIDRFLKTNDLDPTQHFCRDKSSWTPYKLRRGITLEAFVALLYGGAQLRDADLHTREEGTEKNIKWLQKHLLLLMKHSILIASEGISSGDESKFLHFDKEKHFPIQQDNIIDLDGNNTDTLGERAPRPDCQHEGSSEIRKDDRESNDINITADKEPQVEHFGTEGQTVSGQRSPAATQDNSEWQGIPTTSLQRCREVTLPNTDGLLKEPSFISGHRRGSEKHEQVNLHRKVKQRVQDSYGEYRESVSAKSKASLGVNENRFQPKRKALKSINQKYRCKFCQRRFQRNRWGFLTFRRHVKNHEKRYSVSRNRRRLRQSGIPSEIKTETCNMFEPSTNVPSADGKSALYKPTRHKYPRQCEVKGCGLVFRVTQAFDNHTKKHAEKHAEKQRWCHFCQTVVGKNIDNFNRHMLKFHAEKSCPQCPQKFTSQRTLQKHLAHHERQCKYCDRIFTTGPVRLEHEMGVHLNKVQFRCDTCSKEFVHRTLLNKHKKELGCFKQKCNVCNKMFSSGKTLTIHMRHIHQGVPRPLMCVYCYKLFKDKDALESHDSSHTEDDKRRKVCKVCGASFLGGRAFTRHITNVHGNRFCCHFCGKICGAKNNLDIHIRVHTGERPHKCKECGKGFVNASNLKQHTYTHTGYKPFQCDICKKNFRSGKKLTAHKEGAHS